MNLQSLEGNTQRLDGGAMFGNCPRALWERWAAPDEQHRIRLACRSLLVCEDSGRNVLLEAGIGAFFPPELRRRYGVQESRHVLLESLNHAGLAPEDIDMIVLSHLHFDHAGGLLCAWESDRGLRLAFPKATYLVGRDAWERATNPHPRDRASFIPELPNLLLETGRLEIVEKESSPILGPNYSFIFSNGHTPGLMLTRVEGSRQGPITFMGDLIPGVPWVHLPITMGYDRFPEQLIDEKRVALERVVQEKSWIFFTHDPEIAASRVLIDEKGKFVPHDLQTNLDWNQ